MIELGSGMGSGMAIMNPTRVIAPWVFGLEMEPWANLESLLGWRTLNYGTHKMVLNQILILNDMNSNDGTPRLELEPLLIKMDFEPINQEYFDFEIVKLCTHNKQIIENSNFFLY